LQFQASSGKQFKKPYLAFVGGSEREDSTMKASGTLREYQVVGCCLPTPKCNALLLYRMRIFASNHVITKSQLWYFVSQLKKMEKLGEIVHCWQSATWVPGTVATRTPSRL
jgi:hypothetical protein